MSVDQGARVRVLICSFETRGFLYPLLGLACELRQRGHDVAFASCRDTAQVLTETGFERVPRGDQDGDSFILERWGVPLAIAMDVKHIEYAMERIRPSILIAPQLCHAAVLVRERFEIPLAVLGFAAYLWPTDIRAADASGDRKAWRLRESMQIHNDARKLFGLPSTDWRLDDLPLHGDLFMVRSNAAFETAAAHLPAQVALVGSCQWSPGADAESTWDAICADRWVDSNPLVYVQHGRTFRSPSFWPVLTEVFADQPIRIAASVDRMEHRPTMPSPANFFVRGHVEHGVVLPRARAAISNGNTAVVLAALTHGVPQLVIPSGGETLDNAERLLAANCAVSVPADGLNPTRLRSAFDELLASRDIARRAREMAATFAGTRDFATAAALIETLEGYRISKRPLAGAEADVKPVAMN